MNGIRPGSAVLAQCDLLDGAAVKELARTAAAAFGGLDILVNNASSFYPTPLGDIDEDDWNDLIGTNLKAPLFLAQAASAALRERAGLIVNLADIHGMRPLRRHPVYCIAKAGLIMLTKSLARELGPQVRVNAIAPGPVMWPEGGVDAALREEIIARTALERIGSAGGRRPRGALLRRRGAVRHRPDPRGGWRPQHRLVAAARQADEASARTSTKGCAARSKRPHSSPMVCRSVGCITSGASSASGPSM